VTLVRHRQVAGLVRPAAPAAGQRRELVAHAGLLDSTAASRPVLPLRYGTVLAGPAAVEQELLAPHHDRFVAALAALAGRAQFTVRARYEEAAIVREVLDAEPAARRLHRQLGGDPGPARAGKVQLGELVARAILARREADARILVEALRSRAVLTTVQLSPSVAGYRIADAAFLVDLDRQAELTGPLERLAARWRGRIRLRLLGPMAAYHFADHLTSQPGEVP
jgi:hypothetical protein